MGKKKFAVAALDPKYEIYIVHVASFSFTPHVASFGSISLDIHPFQKPQISGLIAKEALTKIPNEYANFADVFSLDLASKFPEHTIINDHTIKQVDGQQPSYGPIYSLRPVKLETLKAYIEINLANGFIRSSKFLASIPILLDRALTGFLRLCVDY